MKPSRTTIYEIAKDVGVSPSTVSRALSGKGRISAATRARIVKRAKELGFAAPNPLAVGLRTKDSQMIGLMIPNVVNPYYPLLVRAVQDAAREAGCIVVVLNSYYDADLEYFGLSTLADMFLRGIIMVENPVHPGSPQLLTSLMERGIHVVVVGDDVSVEGCDLVKIDVEKPVKEALRSLIDHGYQDMLYLGPLEGSRKHAAESLFRQFDLRFAAIAAEPQDDMNPLAEHILGLQQRPDLIFVHNDLMALDLVAALERVGIEVPGELGVMGFDGIDEILPTRHLLTTMHIPKYELGRLAMKLIMNRVEGSVAHNQLQSVSVTPVFRQGETTKPVKQP